MRFAPRILGLALGEDLASPPNDLLPYSHEGVLALKSSAFVRSQDPTILLRGMIYRGEDPTLDN